MTNMSDRDLAEKTTGRPESSRFIPREELNGFTAWRPSALGGDLTRPGTRPAAGAAAPSADAQAALQAARQAGYQDGYRDGLVALDGFKQRYASQVTAQVATLVAGFDSAFAELEAQIAAAVARTATALARQVVRGELAVRPELVAQVAAEAVNTVLLSARHICLFVHPDDLALVQAGAGEALAARGARLLADATLMRGGCRVESDLGSTDARVEVRWAQVAAVLGQPLPFDDADTLA